MKELFYACIKGPEAFSVNRLPARSDHTPLTGAGIPVPVLSLDGEWDFAYYDRPEDVEESLFTAGQTSAHIHVPGHIELQGFGKPQYTNLAYPWDGHEKLEPPAIPSHNPTGLYIKTFKLPDGWIKQRVILRLDGAEPCAFIVVNGQYVGFSEDSFTPSEFDLSEVIGPGENRLCILVSHYAASSWLEDQDFWRFSGLFRSVSLYAEPDEFVRDLSLVPTLSDDLSVGTLTAALRISASEQIDARVSLRCGSDETSKTVRLDPGEQSYTLSLTVNDPLLWSAEAPNLYTAEIVITAADGTPLAGARQQIGFRRFELRNGVMRLNNRRIVFNGVNRHEWSAQNGRAVTEAEIEADLILMKRNNINAVRTSHYPNNSAFYRLCDRYGLYVIDETNLETHGTWVLRLAGILSGTILPDDRPEWRAAVLDRGSSMYERDKNHPCILIWSCGNESFGGKTLYELSEYFRARDPHRLVHYEGIFNDRRYNGTSDMESRMYAKPDAIEKYLKSKPKKPFILCEYAHAMGNSFGNADEYVALADRYEQYQGGFIWDFVDQAITTPNGLASGGDFLDRPTDWYFCGDGLLFADRSESPKLAEAKFLYAPVRLTCHEGGVHIENRYLFLDTDDLTFHWTLTEDGVHAGDGVFTLNVPAGESRDAVIDLPATDPARERVLTVSARLASDTLWAESGHEIAFGQAVLRAAQKTHHPAKPAAIWTGTANIGVRMNRSSAIIDRLSGQLISLRKDGRELLAAPVTADFWRAPTDNDIGSHAPLRWAKWKTASLYRSSVPAIAVTKKGRITAFFRSGDVRWRIEYRFYEDDVIELRLKLKRIKGDAPMAGFSVMLPPEFSKLVWYGNSAPEASIDRRSALRIESCQSDVSSQYVPYLNPQYCANKTDVRRFAVSDDSGCALTLASDAPFEISALPWTSHELENARNAAALPPANKTVLSVAGRKCGVGGDDSWGAPVHKKYLVRTNRGIRFTLRLSL